MATSIYKMKQPVIIVNRIRIHAVQFPEFSVFKHITKRLRTY